jgi:hypothetical protein
MTVYSDSQSGEMNQWDFSGRDEQLLPNQARIDFVIVMTLITTTLLTQGSDLTLLSSRVG